MKKVKYKPHFNLTFEKYGKKKETVNPKNKTELLNIVHNLINNEFNKIEIETYWIEK